MWIENPAFVIKMIFQEPSYWGILIPTTIILYLLGKQFFKWAKDLEQVNSKPLWNKLLAFLLLGLLFFFGIRGKIRMDVSPLGPVDAYFSDYSVLNQLSLNPVFTLIKSFESQSKSSNKHLTLMPDQEAIKLLKKELKRSGNEFSPIAQEIKPSGKKHNWNVVLVLMEGTSAIRMDSLGSEDHCMPFLDSLASHSLFYKRAFSSGIHTHNGIYSTMTGFPALLDRQAMNQLPILRYNSLPKILEKHGYNRIYFTNHDVEFDNVGGFLTENGIDQLVGDRVYPKDSALSTLGVPDDYMFRYSLPYLDSLASLDDPFLAFYMTTSNHKPYQFPDYYRKRFEDDELNGYAYADWSIDLFMNQLQNKPWFDSTIFVFMADHGWAINPIYDLSVNHSHVPLLFYCPALFQPESKDEFALQIDVLPTVLGMLNLPYTNYSLGIDLRKQKREYAFFNSDNKFGVMSKDYLYIHRINAPSSLHKYPARENLIDQFPKKVELMQKYGFMHMQTSSYLIKNNKVGED